MRAYDEVLSVQCMCGGWCSGGWVGGGWVGWGRSGVEWGGGGWVGKEAGRGEVGLGWDGRVREREEGGRGKGGWETTEDTPCLSRVAPVMHQIRGCQPGCHLALYQCTGPPKRRRESISESTFKWKCEIVRGASTN